MLPTREKIALSAREAYSYALCKANMDAVYVVFCRYCIAVTAFISGFFCKYEATKWKITNVCYQYPNSFIDKRYPLIMNRNVKENVQKEKITEQKCTQTQFSYLMSDGSFSDYIHYMATETLSLTDIFGRTYCTDGRRSIKTQALILPKNLTVQGNFVYSGALNKHRLMAFPQNFTVKGSLHINNCTLPKDLSKHNITADSIIFSDCDDMQYAPNILKSDDVSIKHSFQFIHCKDLKKIPEARI